MVDYSSRRPFAVSARLYEGERITSWLERLAANNGFDKLRAFLLSEPIAFRLKQYADLDRKVPDALKSILAEVSRVPVEVIAKHEMDGQRMMARKLRASVCVDCWVEDTKCHRQRHWRRRWIDPLCTCCLEHGMPLIDVKHVPQGLYELLDLQATLRTPVRRKPFAKGRVLEAFLAFERFLQGLSIGTDRAAVDVLFDLLTRWLDRQVGPWCGLEVRQKLALYQFQGRDTPPWRLLFGPYVKATYRSKRTSWSLENVKTIGYRRHLIFHALDVLNVRHRYGLIGIPHVVPGQSMRLASALERPPFFEVANAVGAFAETVMPSRCFDDLRHLERRPVPGGRS